MALPDQLRQVLHDATPLSLFPSSTALANNETRISANVDPAPDASGPALYGVLELTCTFGVAPSANAPVDIYFVQTVDGTTFEDATAAAGGVTPQFPVWTFIVRAVTTAQRRVSGLLRLPPRIFQVEIHNRAGQSMSAGWNVRLIRVSEQIVE
jgi:hypothetical protein